MVSLASCAPTAASPIVAAAGVSSTTSRVIPSPRCHGRARDFVLILGRQYGGTKGAGNGRVRGGKQPAPSVGAVGQRRSRMGAARSRRQLSRIAYFGRGAANRCVWRLVAAHGR
jgi:hypothetical protein